MEPQRTEQPPSEGRALSVGAPISWLPELGASLFACAWFLWLGYGPTLSPTHVGWMYQSDWAAYHWGFSFFRNASWAWPLGNTPELFYPHGTSVGFTDANPWVATLFKLLSPLLPVDFQYAGLWFLLCFVGLALVGTRIARTLTDDRAMQALGGALFAATPLLPARAAHVALCGLFFEAAGLHLHLARPGDAKALRRRLLVTLALVVWAAGTHGYLSAMLLALVLAWFVQLAVERAPVSRFALAGWAAASLGATLFTYVLFGYLGWKPADLTAEGFGQFSGDLTALVNPQRWSRFFAPLPSRPRQWEGFLYLGSGVLLLVAVRLLLLVRARPTKASLRRLAPLVVLLALMWFYSLSSHVAFEGETVWNLEAPYAPFERLTGIVRSSGRFAWPLHFALIAVGISAATSLHPWAGRALLGVALSLQVVELDPRPLSFRDAPLRPLHDPAWATLSADYQHLELLPLHLLWVCQYDHPLVNALSNVAYRQALTFNSGNFMRKEPNAPALCRRHLDRVRGVDPHTVYVVERRYVQDFAGLAAQCGTLDGLLVCTSSERDTALTRALARVPL